jgi:hypothetical protein
MGNETFNIGDYVAKCDTNYASPSFAKSECMVTKGTDFRAMFEFEVDAGEVKKADATMDRKIFDELQGDDDQSKKEIADIKDFMDARKLDKVTLTVMETESDIKKKKQVWSGVDKMF